MAKVTIGFGVVLILLGVGGYVGTGMQSATALIPSIIGVILAALGAWALNPPSRKLAMHIAVVIGVLAIFGTFRGLISAFRWMGGTEPARPAAVAVQAITAVLMIIFVIMCVQSFIAARKNRGSGFDVVSKP